MITFATRPLRRGVAPAVAVAAIALTTWLNGLPSATAADDPAAGESADGLVHCMLPGQVRRMGAFATTVTPRRATRRASPIMRSSCVLLPAASLTSIAT